MSKIIPVLLVEWVNQFDNPERIMRNKSVNVWNCILNNIKLNSEGKKIKYILKFGKYSVLGLYVLCPQNTLCTELTQLWNPGKFYVASAIYKFCKRKIIFT